MEALHNLASIVTRNELKFYSSSVSLLWIIEVDDHQFKEQPAQQNTVEETLARISSERSSTADPYLVLVCVPRSNDGEPHLAEDRFNNVWNALGLDIEPYLKYLLTRVAYGFTHFQNVGNENIDVYFWGHVQYLLIWRYDKQTNRTCGMILPRESIGRAHGRSHGRHAYEEFRDILSGTRHHLRSPHVLACMVAAHCLETIEWTVGHQVKMLRHVEDSTGFGVWGSRFTYKASTTPEFMKMLKDLSNVQVNVANNIRLLFNLDVMLDFILDQYQCWQNLNPTKLPTQPNSQEPSPSTWSSIAEASRTLKQQVAHAKTGHHYLQARANSVSTMILSSLTHEDSETNKAVAKATQEDGSAMKTIAVMTMAFLPATFFAALFSVPSLQWTDSEHVIQSNFWVYWAFAIPATVLVFLFWVLVTRHGNLYHFIMGKARRQQLVKSSVKSHRSA